MAEDDGADLTARLSGRREVLSNEIKAVEQLLGARVDAMDAQRAILLGGLQHNTQLLQEELDRRLERVQLQVDQRFGASQDTLVALKEMLNERYATQTKALDAAFKAAEQAVAVALANAEKAVAKAETAADKRFDAVNEFRQVLSDQTLNFLTRGEYTTAHEAVIDKVTVNADRIGSLETAIVPRNETEAWRQALSNKVDEYAKSSSERITALELRLTSRLDLDQGQNAGQRYQRTEGRERRGELSQGMVIAIMILSALIAVTGVIVAVILH